MKHVIFPNPTERSADECLFWFPQIARAATNSWARDFANSIVVQSRRRGWKPSPKQLTLMRRLVAEWFVHRSDGDDMPLVEEL